MPNVTYRAIRALRGDYGDVQPGQTFTVPDWQAKKMINLEARGIIQRFYARPAINRRQYQVIENKAVVPESNAAIQPASRKTTR